MLKLVYEFHLCFRHHSETHSLKVAYRIMIEYTVHVIGESVRDYTRVSKSLVHFRLNYASRSFATNNPKQSTRAQSKREWSERENGAHMYTAHQVDLFLYTHRDRCFPVCIVGKFFTCSLSLRSHALFF